MGNNNLYKVENTLRSMAKRYKSVKYSLGLAILFLMMGVSAFSEEVVAQETATQQEVMSNEQIASSKENLKGSIENLQSKIDNARKENEKGLAGLKLELIQLMEQGNQVVKSSWSSWQFGAGYIYSSWQSSYKGHGDKKAQEILTRNTSGDPLARFVEGASSGTLASNSYGSTDLALVSEPPAEVEVSAGIRPKDVNKQAPSFTPAPPLGALPPFEPKIIQPPVAPVVTPPQISEPAPLVFGNFGSSISSNYYLWNDGTDGNDVMMKQVTLTAGKIKGKTGLGAYTKGVTGVAGYGTTTGSTLTPGTLTGTTPIDGMNSLSRGSLYGIRDSAFMDWDSNVEISWFGSFGNPLIYMETGSDNGFNNTSLDHLYATGTGPVSQTLYDEVKGYKTQSGLKELDTGSEGINLHNNRGKIYLGDTDTWYNATTVLGPRRLSVLNNQGTITGLNINNGASGVNGSEKQVVFFNSPDFSSSTPQRWIFANGKTGKINMYGKQSLVMYYTSNSGVRQIQNETAFINEGEINLYGIESSGVMISGTETLKTESGFYLNKPINIYSDSSRGVYIAGNISNVAPAQAIARVHIGKGKNDTNGVNWTDIQTNTTTKIDSNGNDSTQTGNTTDTVDGSIGVMYTNTNTGAKIQAPDITLEKFSRKSIGILATDGKLTITNGKININGGESNIGITTKKIGTSSGGDIDFTGDIVMGGSTLTTSGGNKDGIGNIGIFATDGKTVNLTGDLITYNTVGKTKDGIGVFTEKASTVKLKGNADIRLAVGTTGENTGIYAKGAGSVVEIGADQTTAATFTTGKNATGKSKISIDGGIKKIGTAIFAGEGGIVKANGTSHTNGLEIDVQNGAVAIASTGTNSKVNAQYSTITYNGEGYTLYTNTGGEIDVSHSKISLGGNATGFERDVTVGTSPITLTGASITAYSNNVTIMNLRNVPSLTLTTLNASLSTYTGGVTHSAGTDSVTGEVYNKYKIAAVDGLPAYNIDANLDKSLAVDDANASLNDYVFTRRLSVQRAKVNLKAGFNVKAILSNADLTQIGEKTVVGLSMNSSKYATSNNETQINLEANTSIAADRKDAGNGAVGLFINYGKVNTNASSTINIEKEANTVNAGGVGIYSVNGSDVTAEGKINVSGKDSIGILGVAYRTDSKGANVVDEFGASALGQGTVNILNKGEITSDGEGGTGIFAKNNKASTTFSNAIAINDTTGKITLTGNKAVGMSAEKASVTNRGTIDIKGQESTGLFGKLVSKLENAGTINLVSAVSEDKPNIGIFTEDQDTEIHNSKDIIGGNNTYGIYGKTVQLSGNAKIKVGDNSVGIFSNGKYAAGLVPSTISIPLGTTIEVGKNASVGVFTTGVNQKITSNGDMKIGDSSYGFVIRGTGTKLFTNTTNGVTLGNDAIYTYSADTTGSIENRTKLTSTGSKNYGIYAAGSVTNLADINFGSGVGNVGIYSIAGGNAVNGTTTIKPTITVSGSDTTNKFYGIGMAAGYVDDSGVVRQIGTVTNYGTIKVENKNGIGMYATGSGSKAINRGDILLSGKNTTGMYLDQNAIGENYGTIKTVPNSTNSGIVGVVALNGAIIKNYGTIQIDGDDNIGIFLAKGSREGNDPTVTNGAIAVKVKQQADTGKKIAGVEIIAPGNGTATIKRDGKVITPIDIDTTVASATAPKVRVGTTEIDLKGANLATGTSMAGATTLGMYVDTSGVNYTNPIKGLEHLTNLKKINLIFGSEATKYTDSKNIKIGTNILKPYNDVIVSLSSNGGKKFGMASSSLTWIATGTQNTDDTFNAVYLVKIPYTAFAKDQDTFNFMDGLEQRYGVEGLGSREKALYNKLNEIGKGEPRLLAQAVDEMKGHQYANIQQRIEATGNILEKEFDSLRSEWKNTTKSSNKIKTFGTKGEYNSNSTGIIDYKYNAQGVAYVHENEDIKLGRGIGWYSGIIHSKLKFKDLGNSKEEQVQTKVGLYKSVPFDDNNSLNWTISGEVSVGYNKMNRRFLVVDEVFGAKSKYYNYGVGITNEIGKEFRLSESISLRPYGSLALEYGRVSKIREKSGEIKLEVKENNYISVKPKVGAELGFKHYFGTKSVKVGLGAAYENELGKVANGKNKARVANTNANWYNLRGEKEDRRGNVKFDLNLGLDNQRYGVTANVGYDTKGENVRGGLGLRVIF